MKRWLSAALAFVLAFISLSALPADVLAEEIEVADAVLGEAMDEEAPEEPISEQVGLTLGEAADALNDAPVAPDEAIESQPGDLAADEAAADEASAVWEETSEDAVDIEYTFDEGDPKGLELPSSITMGLGEVYKGLQALFVYASGETAPAAGLTWSSSNKKIVTVTTSSGKITAKKKGSAVITAKSANGLKASCKVTVQKKPGSVTLKPAKLKLGAGGMTYALTAKLPSGTASAGITFTSSKPSVATVDADGVVTSVKKGSTVITARTFNGKTSSCKVTVYAVPGKVKLKESEISIEPGKEAKITATAQTSAGKTSAASFTYAIDEDSPDPNCIKVDGQTGVITSLYAGEALVTVTTHNGVSATCAVHVTSGYIKAISMAKAASMEVGEIADALEVTAHFQDGSTRAATGLTWSSSSKSVVSVNASTGKLTAKKAGTAVISAKTAEGLTAKCTITVNKAEEILIKLNESIVYMGAGETHQMTGKISSPKGSHPAIQWSSSNKSVATIDSNGKVKAIAAGTAVVTVSAGAAQDTCEVKVYKAPSSVTILPVNGSIVVGNSGRYNVSLSSGSAGNCFFKSSDPEIASVDDDGIVTGHKTGKVTITVTTYNGKKATATLYVKSKSGGDDTSDDTSDDTRTNADIETVVSAALSQLGKKYVYGGGYNKSNPSGFDCSGLVYWSFAKVGIKLKDSAGKQGADDSFPKVDSIDQLKRGDYVCFKNDRGSSTTCTHTGIYLGNGEFVHASSSAGKVITSSIHTSYWTDVFLWGRRVIQ